MPGILEHSRVDARSDVYALGVIAYEIVTGKSPFAGNSVIETMTLRLRKDPKPPHELNSQCPPSLSEIISKALSRKPDNRYQSAAEMLAAIRGIQLQ
jgi:serine/threonine-protein kinase